MIRKIGKQALIHESIIAYGNNYIGDYAILMEKVILGYPTSDILVEMRERGEFADNYDYFGCEIGDHTIIRSESVIYRNVKIGRYSRTGHKVLIRENSLIGDYSLIGTNVVVDNNVRIGNNVSIQSTVYIPTNTIIEDYVFLGPNCVFLNDNFPVRFKDELIGPRIRKGVTIGGNATILPGIEVGEGAFVAAGAIVTRDVPPWHLAKGAPAKFCELPEPLRVLNKID